MVHENLGMALLLPLLAGLSTTIGSILGFFAREAQPRLMSLILGFAAGVMILISFVELLPRGVEVIGFLGGHMAFFGGMTFMYIVDLLIPHHYMAEEQSKQGRARRTPPRPWRWGGVGQPRHSPGQQNRLLKTAVLVALGVGIHNFPEGVATFTGTLHDVRLGASIALAIAIHNIPEGLAISVPVCVATGSRRKAFLWSFLSGMAEVAGALIAALFLLPFLNETLLSTVLAAVAGVMVFISLDELVPVACSFGEEHLSILGVGIGMAVMALSLWLLRVA
jgi:ZIP family zinc transporter